MHAWLKRFRNLSVAGMAGILLFTAGVSAQQTKAPATISADEAMRLRREGDQVYRNQQWDQALEKYLRAYPRFEHDFDLNYRIGMLYLNASPPDFVRAMHYLREAHLLRPQDLAALRSYAQASDYARRYEVAVPLYRQLVRDVPLVNSYRLDYAHVLDRSGQSKEAIAQYHIYLGRAPSDFGAHLDLGHLLGREKDYAGAMEQFNYVLRFQPRNLGARVGIAQVQAWSGDVKGSLEHVEGVLKDSPNDFDARMLKAYDLLWLDRPGEARPLFQALLREKPQNDDASKGLKEADKALGGAASAAAGGAPQPPSELALAKQQEAQGQYAQAIAEYRQYLTAHPGDAQAELLLARVLGWNKDYAESEAMLRRWVEAHPDHPEGTLQLARVLRWEQKFQESEDYYRRALAATPQNASVHAELGEVLLSLGDTHQALDESRAALSLDSSNADAQKTVIRALVGLKDTAQAQAEFGKLQAAHPEDPDLASLREEVEGAAKVPVAEAAPAAPPQSAEEYFKAEVEKDPANVDAHLQLADVYASRKEFPAAIEQMKTARKLKPDDDAILLKLARVLSWSEQYGESEQTYRQILSRHPEDVQARVELARVLSWNRKYNDSETEYAQALKKRPDDTQIHLEYARVLGWDKRYDASIREFQQVLKREPKNYDALLGEARIYSYQSRWKESQRAYDAALALHPNDREALTGKAQATLWSGDAASARASLQKLHQQNPKDPTVLISLASAENSLGRPGRALQLLDQAQTLAPNNNDARSVRAEIAASLRPELRIGGSYLRDTEGLNVLRYQAVDFRFNLVPRIRNYVTLEYMPTSAPAPLFGYAVPVGGELMFAPRVPINPYVPSPTLLQDADFPPGALVPGSERIHQSAGQFMFGGSMRVNGRFSWTAGVGAVQLRHGSSDFGDPSLFPTTETRFIYTVSPTFTLSRHWTLSVGASRQYWTYTPKAIAQDIHVDQQDASLTWNPDTRTRIYFSYYHRTFLPRFEIPDITLVGPPPYNFAGRNYQLQGQGGEVTATRAVKKWEKAELTLGYDGMMFGYSHPAGLISANYFVNPGLFTPNFYQRHAGLFRLNLTPWSWFAWDLHGTAGEQQIHQSSNFSFSSTAGTRLDFKMSQHTTLTMGYDYFNAASALQALIVEPARAGAYHSNQVSVGLDFKF